jgi:hypothetical protein
VEVVVGIGITALLLILVWITIQKSKSIDNKEQNLTTSDPISLATCISEVSWEEVEKELIRLNLDKQRDMLQMKQAYEELLHLHPADSLKKQFILYLHLNEEKKFVDVYTKEEGDFYTEYMIDQDEWKNVLAYTISREIMNKYSKPTLVCATLFSMTTVHYSSKEIFHKKQAPTG